MPVDYDYVLRLQEVTRFRGQELEQVLHLKQLLKAIHEDPDLSPHFVLIGGTAINLFNPDVPRLSVDIDIDYVEYEQIPFQENTIGKHIKLLTRIGRSLDLKCVRSEVEKSRFELHYVYPSNFTADTNLVKLDVSYLFRTTVLDPELRVMPQLHPEDMFSNLKFRVAHSDEIWAGKAIAAVYNAAKDPNYRNAPRMLSLHLVRHLFDLYQLDKQLRSGALTLDFSHVKKVFIARAVARVPDLYLLSGEGIRKCDEKEFRKDLHPFLRGSMDTEKPIYPSLPDMMYAARGILNQVCSAAWTDPEKEFVDEFQRKGEYRPELLFAKDSTSYKHLVNNDHLGTAAQEQRERLKTSNRS